MNSLLNMLAFSKIMKKYDKTTSRNASKAYLKMVDNSYLGSFDEVNKLMDMVEATFIKHFLNSNRSKEMNNLRPKVKRERHRITFSLGFLFGCSMTLLIALILVIHTRNIINQKGFDRYTDTLFPLYRNIYYWRRYRVKYSFIFGFKEGAEMGYIEVLLLSFGVALLALASVHANLDMEINPKTQDYKAITKLVPIRLLVVPFLHKQIVAVIVAVLEIIRRGIWNFFRLENEHLNNVGKYCAFKSVPLPFNYNEADDKDE
ncbi:hypothetical protein ACSBR2_006268 [Camellia fascicularis]